MRVLSGIQPTGRFHWGNYFGAIRQYIDLQDNEQAYYFIANLHALTTVREPAKLRQCTLDVALDLLALGLDPNKATLFVQSDVPEVSELCWLLMTGTPMGLLERCHAYKDKKAKGLTADAGLFTYPVLLAADILAYDSDTVPVGEDQVQHIEVCRDLAGSFNHRVRRTFRDAQGERARNIGPRARHRRREDVEELQQHARGVRGRQGAAQADHADRHRLAADGPAQRSRPATCCTICIRWWPTDAEREAMAALYRRGGFGYGEVKKALADAAEKFFAEPRARRAELAANPERIREILADGAAKARKKAAEVLKRAQDACGIRGW